MDENGNVKLEYFDKDKLLYTIPESHAAMLSMNHKIATNITNNNTNSTADLKNIEKLPKISAKNNLLAVGSSAQ